jgi:hypothetical protein
MDIFERRMKRDAPIKQIFYDSPTASLTCLKKLWLSVFIKTRFGVDRGILKPVP